MELNGAQILVEALLEQGVDTIFGYPGGQVIGIFDALSARADRLTLIQPSHEQGGCHAADGYARISGQCGVMIATSGPGATNLVTGIANAYMDSIPMVVITGNVSSALIGRDSFQEVDICGVTMPITKHNVLVRDVRKVAETIRDAFAIAISGRPGPVLVDIPKDVSVATCEYVPAGHHTTRAMPEVVTGRIRQAADMIAKSVRPLVFCGGGVIRAGAAEQLRALVEKCNIPVASSLMGLTALPSRHPGMLGMIGMHGTPISNYAGGHCDLLIGIGCRFSDRVAGDRERFAPNARLIHLDVDPSEFDKNVICDLHIAGDAKEVLQQLASALPQRSNKAWWEELEKFKSLHPMPAETQPEQTNPRGILRALADKVGEDAIVVTDVGQHQMWTAQYYPFSRPDSFVTSGGLGTMGFGLGAAIGAKRAAPERTVVLITGDGSFHMDVAELATAVSHELPVIVIVMNNGVLGMVRQWQNIFYDSRYYGTYTPRGTDFAKVAEGFGACGYRADTMEAFSEALGQAHGSGRTCVIDCRIGQDEKVFPMIPPGKSDKDILYCE